ncbi:MAG: response regulator [Planctomycetota bacterium]|jgi:CheY-like chemotaxis protein
MRTLKPILLVEDDEVDAMTVRRALKDLKVTNSLVDSEEKPCVILLDLNMPKMNGIEFLKIAKNNEQLKKIPVAVLTTSKGERNIIESFEFSVAGYIVKPVDYEKFVEAIRVINLYWTLSELPLCVN